MAKTKRKTTKKNRTNAAAAAAAALPSNAPNTTNTMTRMEDGSKIPKSLVVRRGKTNSEVAELVHDMRQMMLPYTAIHFQEDAHNRKLTLQHYSKHVALPMGITHILAFSQSVTTTRGIATTTVGGGGSRLNLRFGKTPDGPTLHFRVHSFTLAKHIQALQRRPVAYTSGLRSHPPVVVTNNFGDSSSTTGGSGGSNVDHPHLKLMRITFQNLFPAINVATVKLSECRRVVLFNLVWPPSSSSTSSSSTSPRGNNNDDNNSKKNTTTNSNNEKESGEKTPPLPMVELRHYAIQATAVGVNRRVRKLVSSSRRNLPNLHRVSDIADYVTGVTGGGGGGGGSVATSDAPSDSEGEEDPRHTIELPDSYLGQRKSQRSALKLVEIGPRLTLSLLKVEKGLGNGDVLYHAHVHKSAEEVAKLQAAKAQEMALKAERRATQNSNVERKRKAMEEKRLAKRSRQEQLQQTAMQKLRQGSGVRGGGAGNNNDEDEEDNNDEDEDDEDEDNNDDEDK